jgi:hypothetical protein
VQALPTSPFVWLRAAAGATLIGACYTGPVLEDPYASPSATVEPASAAGTFDCASGVADVLAACQTCHGSAPRNGAPNALVTRDQLAARSSSNPKLTVAEVSLARMKDKAAPMPPEGVPPKAAVDTLAAWIAAGMPGGTCGATPAGKRQ